MVSNQISEFIDFYTNYSLYICSWGDDYKGGRILRDDIKEKLGLKSIINRHYAITDSLYLLDIMDALNKHIVKN